MISDPEHYSVTAEDEAREELDRLEAHLRGPEPDDYAFDNLAIITPKDIVRAQLAASVEALDSREPDPSREGIFRDHNCSRCRDGALPCIQGAPNRCDYPHARND